MTNPAPSEAVRVEGGPVHQVERTFERHEVDQQLAQLVQWLTSSDGAEFVTFIFGDERIVQAAAEPSGDVLVDVPRFSLVKRGGSDLSWPDGIELPDDTGGEFDQAVLPPDEAQRCLEHLLAQCTHPGLVAVSIVGARPDELDFVAADELPPPPASRFDLTVRELKQVAEPYDNRILHELIARYEAGMRTPPKSPEQWRTDSYRLLRESY
jgi:hypothetical protein